MTTGWDIQQARETYNLPHWGNGYFDVNEAGHIIARPTRDGNSRGIDLYTLTYEIIASGQSLPVLVRFTDILHDRVNALCYAFAEATANEDYRGRYTAVYPIKVNQQRSVVEEILRHADGRAGLEAGSKPELMAVIAMSNRDGGVVICNGYKDREYIRLALIAKQLSLKTYIVVEKLSELELIVEESRALGITPLIGLRVRLASIGQGKWQNTGGEKAKFGLSAAQVLAMVQRLRDCQLLDSLQLLHFHLGSQVGNIRDIQRGMREAARFYAELHAQGVTIACVDVGGGLGVDYEGTRSRSSCSINYSLQEYANNVVHTLAEICAEYELPHPDIVTESGRAMTAHHAVLITNVIDTEQVRDIPRPAAGDDDEPYIIRDMRSGLANLSARSAIETYHDAVHFVSIAHDMYIHGLLTLEQRALAEQLYVVTCREVHPLLQAGARTHHEVFNELNEKLADKYFCNFSVFQSVPDVWAIKQVFPVVPIHRLAERPARRAVIADLTCDSDGRIDNYVDKEGVDSTLPLHQFDQKEAYLLGIFLVGAYQEILGDMHNLFGDTNSVNVEMTAEGDYHLVQPEYGDTVDDVLRYVHFNADDLLQAYRAKIEAAELAPAQREEYLDALEAGLSGYTYLED